MARWLLYLSLIANVALVIYLLLLQGVVPGDAQSDVRTDEIPSLITRQAEQGSYQYYRDAGLTDAEAKGLVLQHLRHQYVDAVPLPEDRFWEQRPLEAQSGYRLRLVRRQGIPDFSRPDLRERFDSSGSQLCSFVSVV